MKEKITGKSNSSLKFEFCCMYNIHIIYECMIYTEISLIQENQTKTHLKNSLQHT